MIVFKYRQKSNKPELIKRIIRDHMKYQDEFYTELNNRMIHHMIFAVARQNHTFQNLNHHYGVMIERR